MEILPPSPLSHSRSLPLPPRPPPHLSLFLFPFLLLPPLLSPTPFLMSFSLFLCVSSLASAVFLFFSVYPRSLQFVFSPGRMSLSTADHFHPPLPPTTLSIFVPLPACLLNCASNHFNSSLLLLLLSPSPYFFLVPLLFSALNLWLTGSSLLFLPLLLLLPHPPL